MVIKKLALVITLLLVTLSACNVGNKVKTPVQTLLIQSTAENNNPYPIQITPEETSSSGSQVDSVSAYPLPANNSELPVVSIYPKNFVNGLVVPTPESGKSIITGQFMKAGEDNSPFISAIFLAPVTLTDDPNNKPKINYSRKSNQLAVQDLGNGKFLFTSVEPGKYAIVIWTPGKSIFLNDSSGNPLIIDSVADEVKDLGVIFYQ